MSSKLNMLTLKALCPTCTGSKQRCNNTVYILYSKYDDIKSKLKNFQNIYQDLKQQHFTVKIERAAKIYNALQVI